MAERPRCVFMGTPELAVPALRVLARRTEVGCVVTQPDRPAGRGRSLRPPPVKLAAQELDLPVWQPETLRGAEGEARLHGADLFVVMAYGELLRQPVLDLPTGACVNLHASLLPRWRGASPLQAALRAGDRETGVSVMRMVRALDAGPVYLREHLPLAPDATLPWLHDAIADCAAQALERFLAAWPGITAEPQDETAVTWCGKLSTADGRLDVTRPAVELARQVRAYHPVPGCWLAVGDDRLRIHQAHAETGAHGLQPGATTIHGRHPAVACGEGLLVLDRLQPPGRAAMDGVAWLNGHTLPPLLG